MLAGVLERLLFTGLEEISCHKVRGYVGEAYMARKCGGPIGAKGKKVMLLSCNHRDMNSANYLKELGSVFPAQPLRRPQPHSVCGLWPGETLK